MSARPRLAVLAVLAAGGTAFGGYYLWPSGRHIASCAPTHAPVPAAAQKALAAYENRIRYDVSRDADGSREEDWYDARTGRDLERSFDADGTPTDAFWTIPERRFDRTVWVTYDDRTYTDDRERTFLPRKQELVIDGQANRDKVFRRRATIVGRESINGKETIHLHEHVHIPRRQLPVPKNIRLPKGFHIPRGLRAFPAVDYQLDTWVDPLTYVTLRTRVSEHGKASVTDVAWLPRTPANLAKLELRIPKDFERDPVQQGSGVGFALLTTKATSIRCA